ncbi:hypothetical protein C347_03971 [Cryptococcus neoformans AD2-60a]|nr:hypothetical protein C347_03971 [Cryptococcus neoformans var. grubii AD2-60a]
MTKHKWDLLLDGLSPQSILSLIALPSRDEPMYLKVTLKDWVYEFFLEVNTYIDHHQDSPLLQQVMYEGYEVSVLSDKRMRNLNANTVKDYSQIFLRILLLLLRYRSAHWEGIHLSIAEEEEKELQVLEEALKVKDKEKGLSAILNIGFMLLNQELTSLDGASWDYTIYKFLVFSSVRMGGVFEEAGNIAPRVTRIQRPSRKFLYGREIPVFFQPLSTSQTCALWEFYSTDRSVSVRSIEGCDAWMHSLRKTHARW